MNLQTGRYFRGIRYSLQSRHIHSYQGNKRSNTLGIILFSSISLTALGLGIWQMKRYGMKVDLIEEIKSRSNESSLSINELGDNYKLGRKVVLEGKFQHSNEVLLGPRAAPHGMFESAQGLATNPQGYFVITPFYATNGKVFLINRGWVPKTAKVWSRPEGTVSVTTVFGSFEKGGTFAPKNDIKSKSLLWLEEESLLLASGLESNESYMNNLILDIISEEATKSTIPYPKSITAVLHQGVDPPTHLVYSATWFSLALAGFYMTYIKFRPATSKTAIKKIIK